MAVVKQTHQSRVVDVLLQRYGQTFSEELGIDLSKPGPSSLFRWLCATLLFSTRISASVAVHAAQALARRGWTTPQKMVAAEWADRTHTLNESGYARYDESTSTKLANASELILDKYGGDLRNLREAAHHDPARERELIEEFKGIGDVGADIFFREMQIAWNELFPFADQKALTVAKELRLGNSAGALAALTPPEELPRLLTSLVRCGLAKEEQAVLEEAKLRARAH